MTTQASAFLRFALLLVFSAVLSACSWLGIGSSAKQKPADLGPNVPVLGVRQSWTATIGSVEGLPLEVQVNGHVVTLAARDGTVAALDGRTGGDIWRTQLRTPLSAGVGSDGKWTAVVTHDNQLVVLEGGKELWRQRLGTQVFTAPLVAGWRVFVLGADRSVSAFDAATGRRLWAQTRTSDPLVLRQAGVLLPVRDTLVAGISGRMVGFNPDNGSIRWEAPIASARGANDLERLIDLVGRVSREGDSVCARAFQAAVGCVDTARGTVVWTQLASGAEGVHGDADYVYGTESNGLVVAWRRLDGTRAWTVDRLKFRKLTAPLALGRAVVIGDNTGLVHLLARDDGAPLNRLSTDDSGVATAPVVAGETLIVVTRKGSVYGFRPE
ncbi:outer membrane protein assembly factor BamB [Extensimonas vulgaris]|uniref:Outer membrane protein assembly factor BamB n=1 Tax=Extensimonas vulgaris TaxID=1031594 RepID=A0A369ANZ1_9BURK|nr:outer membrane protein assembly factor BamB [Extensimonas vulgaris]RCX10901.1 Beta-barrel assembly machine subunit BamB [Extensimonas vulgaris]TWI41573.1 Beta-barrel assembly machine subunit BamB [Extensimonas vulgaris]TXD16050.1 outer membrane protein assembly factor BamB [Extensimonas vulgaris]